MYIDNYKDVKITKIIGHYKIYFKFDGGDFLLKLCEDGDDYEVRLYERVFNNGRLVRMNCVSSKPYVSSISDTVRLKKGIKDNHDITKYVHNQIDIKFFVIKLRLLDLISVNQELKEEINSVQREVAKNNEMIKNLTSIIDELRVQNKRLMKFY